MGGKPKGRPINIWSACLHGKIKTRTQSLVIVWDVEPLPPMLIDMANGDDNYDDGIGAYKMFAHIHKKIQINTHIDLILNIHSSHSISCSIM